MSKSIAEYGGRKSCAITTAQRLAEFLGAQMITDTSGLNCSYIISKVDSLSSSCNSLSPPFSCITFLFLNLWWYLVVFSSSIFFLVLSVVLVYLCIHVFIYVCVCKCV